MNFSFLFFFNCTFYIYSYHTILKNTHSSGIFSQIYNKYLELISCGEEEKNEITNYDAGLNLMLISYIVLDKVSLIFFCMFSMSNKRSIFNHFFFFFSIFHYKMIFQLQKHVKFNIKSMFEEKKKKKIRFFGYYKRITFEMIN